MSHGRRFFPPLAGLGTESCSALSRPRFPNLSRALSTLQSTIILMAVSTTQHAEPQVAIYACPMHPQIRQAVPGLARAAGWASSSPRPPAQALAIGTLATIAMLGVYFGVLTLVSGWDFTVSQFAHFWYYILPL